MSTHHEEQLKSAELKGKEALEKFAYLASTVPGVTSVKTNLASMNVMVYRNFEATPVLGVEASIVAPKYRCLDDWRIVLRATGRYVEPRSTRRNFESLYRMMGFDRSRWIERFDPDHMFVAVRDAMRGESTEERLMREYSEAVKRLSPVLNPMSPWDKDRAMVALAVGESGDPEIERARALVRAEYEVRLAAQLVQDIVNIATNMERSMIARRDGVEEEA